MGACVIISARNDMSATTVIIGAPTLNIVIGAQLSLVDRNGCRVGFGMGVGMIMIECGCGVGVGVDDWDRGWL